MFLLQSSRTSTNSNTFLDFVSLFQLLEPLKKREVPTVADTTNKLPKTAGNAPLSLIE